MNAIIELIRGFFRGVRPWVIVAPWEQGLRVRMGKHVTVLAAGFHLRIPIADTVHIQSTRLRIASLNKQTLTTRDNKTVTLGAQVSYCVQSLEMVYRELHHAEDTIQGLAREAISRYVAEHDADDCTPTKLHENLNGQLDIEKYGLSCAAIRITDYAIVRTYRLIGDQNYGSYGSALSTEQAPT